MGLPPKSTGWKNHSTFEHRQYPPVPARPPNRAPRDRYLRAGTRFSTQELTKRAASTKSTKPLYLCRRIRRREFTYPYRSYPPCRRASEPCCPLRESPRPSLRLSASVRLLMPHFATRCV